MKKALLYLLTALVLVVVVTHPVKDRPWPTAPTNTESAIDISGVIGQM